MFSDVGLLRWYTVNGYKKEKTTTGLLISLASSQECIQVRLLMPGVDSGLHMHAMDRPMLLFLKPPGVFKHFDLGIHFKIRLSGFTYALILYVVLPIIP